MTRTQYMTHRQDETNTHKHTNHNNRQSSECNIDCRLNGINNNKSINGSSKDDNNKISQSGCSGHAGNIRNLLMRGRHTMV